MLKVMSHWKCGEDGCIYKSVTEQRGHSWRWGEDTLYGTAVSQGVQDGNRERDSPPGGRGQGGQGRCLRRRTSKADAEMGVQGGEGEKVEAT